MESETENSLFSCLLLIYEVLLLSLQDTNNKNVLKMTAEKHTDLFITSFLCLFRLMETIYFIVLIKILYPLLVSNEFDGLSAVTTIHFKYIYPAHREIAACRMVSVGKTCLLLQQCTVG